LPTRHFFRPPPKSQDGFVRPGTVGQSKNAKDAVLWGRIKPLS
jgi:hypothetical protein